MKRPGVIAALVSYLLVVGVGLVALRWFEPIRVSGDSMRPALYAGDLVVVARRISPTKGEIALLEEAGGRLVLHRVVRVDPDGSMRTKGDANDSDDPESVRSDAVRGKVVLVIPVGRVIRRWHDRTPLRYTLGSTEQHEAMTEKTPQSRRSIREGPLRLEGPYGRRWRWFAPEPRH